MTPNQSWLLKDNDPLLRKMAKEVSFPLNEHDKTIIDRMVTYIDACYTKQEKQYKIRSGIAVAAPQMGLLKKIIYIHCDIKEKEHKYLIANPTIVAESMSYAFVEKGEGCLSVDKEYEGVVKRRNRVIVKAYDMLKKKDITIDAEGILAICLQHEIDHLSGTLYYDHINKNTPFTIEKDWIKY